MYIYIERNALQPDDHADSRQLLQSTVDGPVGPLAPKLVVAGLRPEVAQTPRLRMAAPLVLANHVERATHKLVRQVVQADQAQVAQEAQAQFLQRTKCASARYVII